MSSILITGGSGFLGEGLTKALLNNSSYERIIILSRSEYKQFQLSQRLNDPDKRLRFFIGDVRDKDRLRRAFDGVNDVIHAAALKRIEVGNYNPIEMVKTNVNGSMNVLEAAQDMDVRRVVGVSSDKAWRPVSPYGYSKAMMESLFLAANNTMGWRGPRFSCVRYGNVFRSTGSIVPVWEEMIAKRGGKYGRFPVTDPNCTRFFMRRKEAVSFVLNTLNDMQGGELNIPKLPAYDIGTLAKAMNLEIDIVGLPPWEKMHEGMDDGNTSDIVSRMSVGELRTALEEKDD